MLCSKTTMYYYQKLFLFIVASSVAVIILYFATEESRFFVKYQTLYNLTVDTSVSPYCSLPDYDPWDSSISKFILPASPIYCPQVQPELLLVNSNGWVEFNKYSLNKLSLNESEIACTSERVVRKLTTEKSVSIDAPETFHVPGFFDEDFTILRCYRNNRNLIYDNVHYRIRSPRSTNEESVRKPSVFVFAFESMSRLNFIRQLPRTYKYLVKSLDAIVLKGVCKVGDNTYPNMVPFLTGKQSDISNAKSPADNLPLIFRNFSNAQYITLFAEDRPDMGMFNFHARGFSTAPADFYMLPFWLTKHKIASSNHSLAFCFGSDPEYSLLFDYTRDFLNRYKKHPTFAFSFLTDISHGDLNKISAIDDDILGVLLQLEENKALDETILIVMGDHGARFGGIRSTVVGRYEERMPFVSVTIPPRLREKYPGLVEGLVSNKIKLMSWYDMYELLMDVVKDNLGPISVTERWGTYGLSPFRPIPPNRSCADVGVPDQYCVCDVERPLDRRSVEAKKVAQLLVVQINKLVQERAPSNTCAPLTLRKVKDAQIILPNEKMSTSKGFTVRIQVTVEVNPSRALLEGSAQRNAFRDFVPVGQVLRIDKYADQSFCTDDPILKLYCYCT